MQDGWMCVGRDAERLLFTMNTVIVVELVIDS